VQTEKTSEKRMLVSNISIETAATDHHIPEGPLDTRLPSPLPIQHQRRIERMYMIQNNQRCPMLTEVKRGSKTSTVDTRA
jgi:hypothetical protein